MIRDIGQSLRVSEYYDDMDLLEDDLRECGLDKVMVRKTEEIGKEEEKEDEEEGSETD